MYPRVCYYLTSVGIIEFPKEWHLYFACCLAAEGSLYLSTHMLLFNQMQGLVHRWYHVSNLEWHTCPVLSLASLKLPQGSAPDSEIPRSGSSAASAPGCLLVSGATDGSLALWCLEPCEGTASPGGAAGRVTAQRLLSMPSVHQSGINAASMAFVADSAGTLPSVCILQDEDSYTKLVTLRLMPFRRQHICWLKLLAATMHEAYCVIHRLVAVQRDCILRCRLNKGACCNRWR